MKKVVYEIVLFLAMVLPPAVICILHWLKPWKLRSFKKCALLAIELSLYSWVLMAVLPRVAPEVFTNGAANAFALLFGWFYIWPFFIVVACMCFVVRLTLEFLMWLLRSLQRMQAS